MKDYSVRELFDLLNQQDECNFIEAKDGDRIYKSTMESVCSFSNEPGLGGGYILIGVNPQKAQTTPSYEVKGVAEPDKLQADLATQCRSRFNQAIRPNISVEQIKGKNVLNVFVPELPETKKPLYFKKEGLPHGAYRRIGSTDQYCTEEEISLFFQDIETYDSTVLENTSFKNVNENAIVRYRILREKVNPSALELTYSDTDLLQTLGCFDNKSKSLTLAGLLLFGDRSSLRRLLPMVRVDYIRIPGNKWVANPGGEEFTSIDMRDALLLLAFRVVNEVNADLPKGFVLEEDQLQAGTTGLPVKVLREAIHNALMHCSYREGNPLQVIRYDNRIEISNPGFSLKPEEQLGEPGSNPRNKTIAAVFHETNLAETKGTGIRRMRELMKESNLAPPTFDSDREGNKFTTRLLLHHFLDEEDLNWLDQFDRFNLNQAQKQALIFVREVEAVDNITYRQLSDCDTLTASKDLRIMREAGLLQAKGKGKATYYIPGEVLKSLIEPVDSLIEPGELEKGGSITNIKSELPEDLLEKMNKLGKRTKNKKLMKEVIVDLCDFKPMSAKELAQILGRDEKYLKNNYLKSLKEAGKIKYTIEEMEFHPNQKYVST